KSILTYMCVRIRLEAPENRQHLQHMWIHKTQPKQPREKAAWASNTKTSHAILCGGDTLPTKARVVTRGYW
ncbi:hypothetical protein COCMIDRAFT_97743, partial [Bipolaris oryzae ATCC 44560]